MLSTDPACVWSTVTLVLLPGHDDGKEEKAEKLLHKAFQQAGYGAELLAHSVIEFRRVGFRAGVELAQRYVQPPPLHCPSYHVRVQWFRAPGQRVAVPGPLAVGAGRYRGLGLFAAETSWTGSG